MHGNTSHQPDRDSFDILSAVPDSATRYDLALAFIPTVFVLAIMVGTVLDLSMQAALVSAALAGILVLVDALYLNPPIKPGSE